MSNVRMWNKLEIENNMEGRIGGLIEKISKYFLCTQLHTFVG